MDRHKPWGECFSPLLLKSTDGLTSHMGVLGQVLLVLIAVIQPRTYSIRDLSHGRDMETQRLCQQDLCFRSISTLKRFPRSTVAQAFRECTHDEISAA